MAGGQKRTARERFDEKCKRLANGCLEWQGGLTSNVPGKGYGQFYPGAGRNMMSAHRWNFEDTYGVLPEDQDVCHQCDYRRCVELTHLFPGDRRANMQDAKAKGRLAGVKRPNHSGQKHHAATITEAEARRMLELHAAGSSIAAIGREIPHAAYMTIYRVINRVTWTHLSKESES